MTDLLRDIRFAYRALARSPWFAALAVLTLILGIGASTALFSLVDAVLLRALPYKDPDRLVAVWGQDAERSGWRLPIPLVEPLRERSASLEAISIHNIVGGTLRTPEGPVQITGDRVSPNFVELMGVPPLAGRGFRADEANPGASPVIILSHALLATASPGRPRGDWPHAVHPRGALQHGSGSVHGRRHHTSGVSDLLGAPRGLLDAVW